jgi:hypothetical protein
MDWNGSILIASAVASVGIWVTVAHHSINTKNEEIKKRQEIIHKQLSEFYVPLMSYMQTSKALSKQLYNDKPEDFNLLTYLLDNNYNFKNNTKVSLSEKEKELLVVVMSLSDDISKLLIEKGGLAEDERLTIKYVPNKEKTNVILSEENKNMGLIGYLLSHYKIMKSAHENQISGNVDYFKQFRFPREIGDILKENYDKLNKELKETKLEVFNFLKC